MSLDQGLYWVGDIPSRPMDITVMDDNLRPVDLNMYTNVSVRMVGSDNEEVDLSGSQVQVTSRREGKVRFFWPAHSVFTKPGEYVMQLVLSNSQVKDSTTARTIYVRELGGTR